MAGSSRKSKKKEKKKNGDGKSNGRLAPVLDSPNGVLDFHWEQDATRFIAHLELINRTHEPIFYKLKTTHPQVLRVQPTAHGFLKPDEAAQVNVTSKIGLHEKTGDGRKEKYVLVQSAFVGDKKANPRAEKKLGVREMPRDTPFDIKEATVVVQVMDPPTPPPAPSKTDWRLILGAFFLVALLVAVGLIRSR